MSVNSVCAMYKWCIYIVLNKIVYNTIWIDIKFGERKKCGLMNMCNLGSAHLILFKVSSLSGVIIFVDVLIMFWVILQVFLNFFIIFYGGGLVQCMEIYITITMLSSLQIHTYICAIFVVVICVGMSIWMDWVNTGQ